MKAVSERERAKYSRIWEFPTYSDVSPGLEWVKKFWEIAKPNKGETIIDVGAGGGAASRELSDRGLRVLAFDITNAAWKHDDIPLTIGSVWHGLRTDVLFDYAYCCDMLEHIPTEFVGLTISNILSAAARCFFSVGFTPDVHGRLIGEPLHLTVRPFTWWRETFRELGHVDDARDMLGQGIFYVHR